MSQPCTQSSGGPGEVSAATFVAMPADARLVSLDGRLAAAPAPGETWTAFYARLSRRRELQRAPIFMAIRELLERVHELEARVAELEGAKLL